MDNITLQDILYAVITVVLPLVLRYVYLMVRTKVDDYNLKQAVDAVYAAVEYVNQTFVDSLKKSGSFDAEAQRVAYEKAVCAARETMQASTISWITDNFDGFEQWLDVQIERAVKEAKLV